jgi:CHAD domain-containing protein
VANTKEIVGFDASADAVEWAAEVLRTQFEQILAGREKALQTEDIEGVHQLRVAIRRLRSALRDFTPLINSPSLKEAKKELKKLAKRLGTVRDQDVAIAALEKLREKAKKQIIKADLEQMIAKRRTKREKAQIGLTKILDESSIENLRENFSKGIDEAVEKSEKKSNLTAKEAGRELILKGLQEFCDLSPSLYNHFYQTELHQLRIAVKRLRYAIELFTVCYGEQIAPFAKEMTGMQTYLGELHDCDLWIENLHWQLSLEKRKRQTTNFWLMSRFTKQRTRNYRAALDLWSKWRKNKFVKRLQKVLETES